MAWRTLELDNHEWSVTVAAEMRPGSDEWRLVAAFRTPRPDKRSVWVPLPVTSPSKAVVYARADQLSHDDLADALRQRLTV